MRYLKLGLSLVLTLSLLSGCSFFTSSNTVKEREVKEYNSLVETTIGNYATSNTFAENNKEALLDFVLSDKAWSLLEGKNSTPTNLTTEQIEAFELHDVLYDEYFTALGSSGVREVLIIKGWSYEMYVTVIWGTDEVISIDRVVTKS